MIDEHRSVGAERVFIAPPQEEQEAQAKREQRLRKEEGQEEALKEDQEIEAQEGKKGELCLFTLTVIPHYEIN